MGELWELHSRGVVGVFIWVGGCGGGFHKKVCVRCNICLVFGVDGLLCVWGVVT